MQIGLIRLLKNFKAYAAFMGGVDYVYEFMALNNRVPNSFVTMPFTELHSLNI